MIVGSKVRYAVMALVDLHLNSAGKPVALADIAERQEVSLAYLEQIFAKLRRSGLVEAMRGPGGGYLFAKEASLIKVSMVLSAVEESVEMTRCDKHSHEGCMTDKSRCLTHDVWEGLGDHIENYLSSISIADICKRSLPKVPVQITVSGQAA